MTRDEQIKLAASFSELGQMFSELGERELAYDMALHSTLVTGSIPRRLDGNNHGSLYSCGCRCLTCSMERRRHA